MILTQRRTCSVCGIEFSTERKLCPVCLLRMGYDEEIKSGGSSSEKARTGVGSEAGARRFEHYEILCSESGTPLELGRGAMGVTYKAFDVNLQYPVALKVITERYLGDESARLRFLREARTAASLRHPNVASVFHLGKSGSAYFYAMEFVEGETLDQLIRRSGRLEVTLALEIITQVAAGLTAMHEKNLVHRDIKPSNIMVRLEAKGMVTAKIIDLGLAKATNELATKSTISAIGAFAGTPEFASPEQFSGIQVDIRSDLYSLGVTLWEAVAGERPFRGTPAEVMYQHQRTFLPLEELEDIPQAVVVLLEALLEKDPGRRFQTPVELLKAMPTITGAIDQKRIITRQSLQKTYSAPSRVVARDEPRRRGPEKISVARLPVSGSDLFGREEELGFLDRAWANQEVNVVTIVAWAGVGKSSLVKHWLRRMAADQYRSAELIFAWSFYKQGSSGETSSADEFFSVALNWFGDREPGLGTEWEKGERLAQLLAHRRTLLVLDGLEPLQNPPGSQEGRIRDASMQALLRELASFNKGLCLITTRLPVADLADHESSSVLRRDLEQLSDGAGATLLRALGVTGQEAELQGASNEFSGHCLALTLLGSYLTDAYHGDIRCRSEISTRLGSDVRQGAQARKIMESYQTWLGEGPELAILRMLGLFDRPAEAKAMEALRASPAIPGLTDSLTDLRPAEWQTILARLRRAQLLAGEDLDDPGNLDTHPLVREYFGEQLRREQMAVWKECNRRLYHYYRNLPEQLPGSFLQMEPLFLAVICGCKAGLFREALQDVYIPRIQRGDLYYAANVLGAKGPLLTVLANFFEGGCWGSFVKTADNAQRLGPENKLFILMQAAAYLTGTLGSGSLEARICYERAESLTHSVGRPLLLHTLLGQWRYTLVTDKLSAAMKVADRVYSVAQKQDDPKLVLVADNALACTHYFLGNFESSRKYALHGIEVWRSGTGQAHPEDVDTPVVGCMCYRAFAEWHLGETASCKVKLDEAISLAKELRDMHALAVALGWAAGLAAIESNPAEVDRLAAELIELSARHQFLHWQSIGAIHRGWARSASGNTAEGIPLLEQGIRDFRATGWVVSLPYHYGQKAEVLHLADRTSEALEAIREAEKLIERTEEHQWSAELHRLRAVFLAALGEDENQIEEAFGESIRIAREQKSVALEKRSQGSYAEYGRQRGDR